MQIYVGYSGHGCMAQWLEQLTADQQVAGSIPVGRFRQSNESDISDVHQQEPNHNVIQNDYKKFS